MMSGEADIEATPTPSLINSRDEFGRPPPSDSNTEYRII